ncbi:hypothetical protein GCM10025734_08560 [Kitasatospora paranensis]
MNWKYWVTRKMNPKSAKNATVTDPLAAENAGVRNRVRSIIGWLRRRSTRTKTTVSTAARAKPVTVAGALQPRVGASMIV